MGLLQMEADHPRDKGPSAPPCMSTAIPRDCVVALSAQPHLVRQLLGAEEVGRFGEASGIESYQPIVPTVPFPEEERREEVHRINGGICQYWSRLGSILL